MTETEFADAIRTLCQRFGGSVTSWGRTIAHNKAVGGVLGSAHTWFLGADVVWDDTKQDVVEFLHTVESLGLRMIVEKDHAHFQPANWKNKEHPA